MKVTDPDGVQGVSLDYQLVNPGNYIRLTDAAYDTSWTTLVMHDDGLNGDTVAGDSIYSVDPARLAADESSAWCVIASPQPTTSAHRSAVLMPTTRSRISRTSFTTEFPAGPAPISPALHRQSPLARTSRRAAPMRTT